MLNDRCYRNRLARFASRSTLGRHGIGAISALVDAGPTRGSAPTISQLKSHGLTAVSKNSCDPRDPWSKKRNNCLVKTSHAEYAKFAEAHTHCLCLPSWWWCKCSVRLCVFLTYNSISFPDGFRDFRVFCVKKYNRTLFQSSSLTPEYLEELRVSFNNM